MTNRFNIGDTVKNITLIVERIKGNDPIDYHTLSKGKIVAINLYVDWDDNPGIYYTIRYNEYNIEQIHENYVGFCEESDIIKE